MKSQETNLDVPSAGGFSSTKKNVVNFKHIWTVKNFAFFLEDSMVTSPLFNAQVGDGVEWRLKLYPTNSPGENREYVALYLSLRSANKVYAAFKLFIVGSGQELVEKMNSAEPHNFNKGIGWGDSRFMHRGFLFKNSRTYLPDDHLRVACEISYLLEPAIISLNYSLSQTKVFASGPEKEPAARTEDLQGPAVRPKVRAPNLQEQPKPSGLITLPDYRRFEGPVVSKAVHNSRDEKKPTGKDSKSNGSAELTYTQQAEACLKNLIKVAEEVDRQSVETTRLIEQMFDKCIGKLKQLQAGSGEVAESKKPNDGFVRPWASPTAANQGARRKIPRATVPNGAAAGFSMLGVSRAGTSDDDNHSTD